MPVMSGYEATEVIRKLEQQKILSKRVPIIALTGHTTDQLQALCKKVGMDEFLAKPSDKNAITKVICKYTS